MPFGMVSPFSPNLWPGRESGVGFPSSACLSRHLARERRNAQCRDAVAALAQYVKAEAVEGEALSWLRNRARFVDDDAGDGRRLVVRDVPVHRPIQVAHRHGAIDI